MVRAQCLCIAWLVQLASFSAAGAATEEVCEWGGDAVCPYSGIHCAGRQCCPGSPETNSSSFVCPSADPAWQADGQCQLPYKVVDCVGSDISEGNVTITNISSSTSTTTATTNWAGDAKADVDVVNTMHRRLADNSATRPDTFAVCASGEDVMCPYSDVRCGGRQCCPGSWETDNRSFVCPSADHAWDATGQCQHPYKLVDCTAASKNNSNVTTSSSSTTTTSTSIFTNEENSTAETRTRTTSPWVHSTVTATSTSGSTPTTTVSDFPGVLSTTMTWTSASTSEPSRPSTATTTSTLEPPAVSTATVTTSTTSDLEVVPQWCEAPAYNYRLEWSAKGLDFFDAFDFLTTDYNHGAALYMNRSEAVRTHVIEAYPSHAILRTGARLGDAGWPKRASAKIQTKKSWKHFLLMMRFTHVPWGCGVWPAVWTKAADGLEWPDGGELDVLEYVNDGPQQTSFHTGSSNPCKLDSEVVNSCGPMPDTNKMGYDCYTAYPDNLGCAPNKQPLLSGQTVARSAGLMAVQWTEDFMKVFHIPESSMPADANSDLPKPETWGQFLVSYYPFAASNKKNPGSCPPENVMAAQHLVLNINMCGDWAGKIWNTSGSCVNMHGPSYPLQCRAVDPLMEYAPEADCCTQFIWDANNSYGTEGYLKDRAYFNISWVKVFRHVQDQVVREPPILT